jgi:gamma-glutamyl-gamma-aminobutyrate hydrolase PuuD
MGEAQALLIGGGPDIEANGSEAHMAALRQALAMDVPVLAIGSGMQLLNLAFGGQLLDSVPEHAPLEETSLEGTSGALRHQVYVTPGSKLSAILGPGGFFRVNSWHRRGLREAQRAPGLLTSAYSLEDGVVEAVESPAHDWVIGVQFQPERTGETPRAFSNLFTCFAQRTEPR